MHSLTISFGPSATTWALMFKTEEAAKAQYDALTVARPVGGPIAIKDDFGQNLFIKPESLHCVILEDLDQTQIAIIARSIHQAQTQAKAQQQATNDPVLKTAAMTQRGPAMLTPMNGRFQS
jgi:hypothetical protein